MDFSQFTSLEEFENCIWHNEIPSDQFLDRMMVLTFPEEVGNPIFRSFVFICSIIYLITDFFRFPDQYSSLIVGFRHSFQSAGAME